MVASIYVTVVIALERYNAVCQPINTYIAGGDEDGTLKLWLPVLKYVGPVIIFSVVINISKFFEFVVECNQNTNHTLYCEPILCPGLRLNEVYIKYYINLFREEFSTRQKYNFLRNFINLHWNEGKVDLENHLTGNNLLILSDVRQEHPHWPPASDLAVYPQLSCLEATHSEKASFNKIADRWEPSLNSSLIKWGNMIMH